jgi:septal ring factor EnvC (AmiA/AmiB activator)
MNFFKKQDKELGDLQVKIADLETLLTEKSNELDKALNDLKDKDQSIADLTGELNAAKSTLTEKDEKISGLEKDLESAKRDEAEFEARVAKKAQETLAKSGHTAIEIETDSSNEPTLDVLAQFKKLKGAEAAAFLKEHKTEIFKALKSGNK